jgi:hypothetical protein
VLLLVSVDDSTIGPLALLWQNQRATFFTVFVVNFSSAAVFRKAKLFETKQTPCPAVAGHGENWVQPGLVET